jgi:hypothetical protein
MATTTPNFSWPVPTSTDLVKDGATAIEALGDSIDASLVDLKGGTSGQVLAKNSNTDMDFTWVTDPGGDITGVTAGTGISGGGTSGTVTVTNSMATAIDAKGDLIAGTGADTFSRIAVGTNGQVLTADSAEATGLKWAAAGGGGLTLLSTTNLTGSSTTVSTISQDYIHLYFLLENARGTSDSQLSIAINGDTTQANYQSGLIRTFSTTAQLNHDQRAITGSGIDNVTQANQITGTIFNYTNATFHTITTAYAITADNPSFGSGMGVTGHNGTSAITSLAFSVGAGTWSAGTVKIYGVK